MSRSVGDYRPREAEHAVQHRVLDEHLDAFLETTRRQADGVPRPAFVEEEFCGFLTCGILAHGFARLRCTECALERAIEFRPLPPPTDDEVRGALARIAARVQRLLRRRGRDPWEGDGVQADPLVDESPTLAGLSSASVQGRIALGPHAGARVWRLGDDPDAPWVLSTVPRHAYLAGFDLHANVAVPATDRARLEQLCRYLLRPAVAQDRLRQLDDGRVVLTLKSAWADGTRQLLFEPLTLLEKLAALIPRPRINLVAAGGRKPGLRGERHVEISTLFAGVLGRGHPSGPAACSGRKSRDADCARCAGGGQERRQGRG
jgi:hypothetical protein